MSGREFERVYNFAHQTMIDATAGTFEDLPERIVLALAHEFEEQGLDLFEWLAEEYGGLSGYGIFGVYKTWRRFDREQYAEEFRIQPRKVNWSTSEHSPGSLWILDTGNTPTSTCKKLKVPPATLRRWLSGDTIEMPGSLREALVAIDFPWTDTLASMQKEHYS